MRKIRRLRCACLFEWPLALWLFSYWNVEYCFNKSNQRNESTHTVDGGGAMNEVLIQKHDRTNDQSHRCISSQLKENNVQFIQKNYFGINFIFWGILHSLTNDFIAFLFFCFVYVTEVSILFHKNRMSF